MADKVISSLSEKLCGNISVEKVHFKPFSTIVLKNTLITDKSPAASPVDSTLSPVDTFFRAEYIIATFSLSGLMDKESIKIQRAYVSNAQMNLVLEDLTEEDGTVVPYNNLSKIFGLKKNKDKKEPRPDEIFRIRNVKIENMGFALLNRSGKMIKAHEGGIDWNDLDIKSIYLEAEDLRFKDGIMSGKAQRLSFKERTGFHCSEMAGDVRVGRGKTIIDNLYIKDRWSDLYLPLFMMSYKNVEAFKDFLTCVRLDGTIEDSVLDFRTIACFAPQLSGNRLKADLSGTLSGTVSDFTVKDIRISSKAGGFSGVVNGRMKGVPETEDMWIDASVTGMRLTAGGLGRFVSEWMRNGELDFSKFAKGITFNINAKATGYLNNLDTRVSAKSQYGDFSGEVRLDDIILPSKPIRISGNVTTDRLDLGKVADIDILGPASLSTGLTLDLEDGLAVSMDSLRIEKIDINDYDYSDILAKGRYDSRSLNATVISKDPNLNFIFQGGYARSEKSQNTVYKFNASVGHADLNAINIDKRGKSAVQLRTSADFTKTAKGDILGRVDIGEIILENKAGRYELGDIILTSHSADDRYTARLNSTFANGSFNGSASIIDFVKDVKGLTLGRELPALIRDSSFVWKNNTYDVDFICHDMQNLLSFAAPGLYIEDGTSISADINSDGELKAEMKSNRVAVRKNYLKGFNLSLNNLSGALRGEAYCDEISIASMTINDNILQLYADNNHVGAGYSFENKGETESMGEFIVNGEVSDSDGTPVFDIDIKPSSLKYNLKEWTIQPSKIRIEGKNIEVDSFGAVSGEELVSLHGRTSDNPEDQISLYLERFSLDVVNSLLPNDLGVKGVLTGTATLTSPLSTMNLSVDMLCDSSYIANVPLGELRLGTRWNEEHEDFDIFARNRLNGRSNLNIEGCFKPKNRILKAEAVLDKMEAGYAQPFLKDIFSEMRGHISGKLSVDGPLNRLKIQSRDTRIDDAWLKIGYTGVPYMASGPFHIDETGVYFDDIAVRDRYDGTGRINGSINYDYFRDFSFDMRFSLDRIEGIDLAEKDNEYFYGNIFGTGDITLTGPVRALVMKIDAQTAKAGQIHIPTTSASTSSTDTNLLKFKQMETFTYIDPYDIFVQKAAIEEKTPSDFRLKLNVNARPDVEAFVEIDKASGNVLSGKGSGNIAIETGTDLFRINGDYTIESGNYKFVAMGLVNRDFQIQEGSSIRFGGDILESTLDIDAIYRTKASIATLISDTTSVANRRTVDCGISIKDKISSPQLSFSIEIPDLDPTIKSRVESALSTEDKVQKQFLSLLISNNFLPDEQSGIVNNSSVLYSNVSEMMANQINNIFQKLNIPLDLGLRYQPNTRGNDIFDVAVSTQLFNNRVVVNGNIGNKQYSSGNTKNEVVGDIDIEIKLDRSGSFRLNLFSHSADQYTNFLDNSQRNGVGITYQTEFDTFRQFFKNLFSSRKKRQEAKIAEEKARLEDSRTQITIK